MDDLRLCDSDYRFMSVVWDSQPVGSGQLVRLCQDRLGWKKSTTYTVLKKLCDRGFVQNRDATVTAQVRASGFRHASLGRRNKRPATVVFDAADCRHEGGDLYSVSRSDLYKYAAAIFGDGVSIESFISDSPKFIFPEVSHKKVPVRRVHSISFASQYMSEEGMQMQPDRIKDLIARLRGKLEMPA